MGRTLRGTGEFEYKYVYGRQPENLAWLVGVSGVGKGSFLINYLVSTADGGAEPLEASELAPHAGAPGRERLRPIEAGADPKAGFEALRERERERVPDIRRRYPDAVRVELIASASYTLEKSQWPGLLAWINGHLPADLELSLDEIARFEPDRDEDEEDDGDGAAARGPAPGERQAALLVKRGAAKFLPYMAMHILAHAVRRDLGRMDVDEMDPPWEGLLWEGEAGDADNEEEGHQEGSGEDEERDGEDEEDDNEDEDEDEDEDEEEDDDEGASVQQADFDRGAALLAAGEYDAAIAHYSRMLEGSRGPEALFYRGLAWARKGEEKRAIDDYSAAIERAPSMAEAYNNRGASWHRRLDFERAMADYDRAIALDPGSAMAFMNRGEAWLDQKEYARAVEDLSRAIELDPESPAAYGFRGRAYVHLKVYGKALADAEAAAQRGDDGPLTFLRAKKIDRLARGGADLRGKGATGKGRRGKR